MNALERPHGGPSGLVAHSSHTSQIRSGPIPEADELDRYEKILPGLANRIMKMAEDEAAARRQVHDTALNAQIADDRRGRIEKRIGQVLGFLLAGFTLTLSYLAAIKGAVLFGTIIGGISIGSLCLAFVLGRLPRESN